MRLTLENGEKTVTLISTGSDVSMDVQRTPRIGSHDHVMQMMTGHVSPRAENAGYLRVTPEARNRERLLAAIDRDFGRPEALNRRDQQRLGDFLDHAFGQETP